VAVGYHASHEQYRPSSLLTYVIRVEQAGFQAAMCSDHFHPWSERQGHSGHAWSWMAAALQATGLPMGTVCAPGQRYHPAVVAQAAATLAEMYPDRFWLALGTGQDLNEHITGQRWPNKADCSGRLLECVEVIRALWRGETVTHRGAVVVEGARLYTRHVNPPRLVGAAITAQTASWVAWADAFITIGMPMALQVQLSYAPSEDDALRAAHDQWGPAIFDIPVLSSLRMPADFDAAAGFVRPDDVSGPVLVSADLSRYAESLAAYHDLGFSEIYLHNVHRDQERFIEDFGERVLPSMPV
jgi:coenzyme F420-dependent glucose-6-phosphate dehydrogenase